MGVVDTTSSSPGMSVVVESSVVDDGTFFFLSISDLSFCLLRAKKRLSASLVLLPLDW